MILCSTLTGRHGLRSYITMAPHIMTVVAMPACLAPSLPPPPPPLPLWRLDSGPALTLDNISKITIISRDRGGPDRSTARAPHRCPTNQSAAIIIIHSQNVFHFRRAMRDMSRRASRPASPSTGLKRHNYPGTKYVIIIRYRCTYIRRIYAHSACVYKNDPRSSHQRCAVCARKFGYH